MSCLEDEAVLPRRVVPSGRLRSSRQCTVSATCAGDRGQGSANSGGQPKTGGHHLHVQIRACECAGKAVCCR